MENILSDPMYTFEYFDLTSLIFRNKLFIMKEKIDKLELYLSAGFCHFCMYDNLLLYVEEVVTHFI